MRQLITLALIMVSLFMVSSVAAQDGQKLGETITEDMLPLFNTMHVGADNNPVLVASDGAVIQAWRWDGTAWTQLGEGVTIEGLPSKSAVGPNGEVLVTYLESSESGGGLLKAALWDGSTWTTLGDFVNLSENAMVFNFDESLAVTPEGQPVIAWTEAADFTQPDQVYVRQWDGSTWQFVGTDASLNLNSETGTAGRTTLAALPEGGLMLAWDEDNMVFARQWDGTAWTDPAQVGQHTDYETDVLDLTTTPAGVVLFRTALSEGRYEVSVFADGAWTLLEGVEAATSLIEAGYLDQVDVAADENGTLYLAWVNNTDSVTGAVRWNGSAWENAGAPITFESLISAPVAIDQAGTLYTARLDMMAGATGVEVFAYPVQ